MRKLAHLIWIVSIAAFFTWGCKREKSQSETQVRSESALAKSYSIEYSSAPAASVNAKGKLLLPDWEWSGRISRGSTRYQVIPID